MLRAQRTPPEIYDNTFPWHVISQNPATDFPRGTTSVLEDLQIYILIWYQLLAM